jgi:chromosome segregation ATPase
MNDENATLAAWSSPRPESASSSRSILNEERAQLQSRIQALEYENERLRVTSLPPLQVDSESLAELNAVRLEYEEAESRVSQLEAKLNAAEQSLEAQAAQMLELESAREQVLSNLDEEKAQGESRLQTLQAELEDTLRLAKTLKETVSLKETAERESEGKLKAKQAELASLELRLKRTQTELEEDRLELGGQVHELRQAGQVGFFRPT